MLSHIKSLDELEKEAIQIDNFLNITCSEDGNEAAERGNELNVYMARTGKMLADAKYHKDIAINSAILLVSETYKSLPITTKNNLADSMCHRENYMVTWIERLNKTCTHQQSFMVTLISKAKEEMKMSGYTGNANNNTW